MVAAILPVHWHCTAADVETLRQIADRHSVALVEDCAQAHGARFRGKAIGTWGHAGAFSFHNDKLISSGEGGIIAVPIGTVGKERYETKDPRPAGIGPHRAGTGGRHTPPNPPGRSCPGSAPVWANSRNLVGSTDPAASIGFRVYLGWKADAEALARAVSDPASAQYGRYLTPQQFRRQFAPSQSEVGAVQAWLRGQGFAVDYTPSNNHYVAAEGTVAQATAAFGVDFGMYSVQGQTVRSPKGNVTVPSPIAASLTGVIGLDEGPTFVHPDHVVDAPPAGGFRNAPPLSSYWNEFTSPYAYPAGFTDVSNPATASWLTRGNTTDKIKSAYGISGYDGAGQTVAMIDAYASPTIVDDVNTWSANRGIPGLTPSQFAQVVAPGTMKRPENRRQDPQGWYGEETLDIEAVHGIAPAANIVYVGAPNNYQDLDASMNHVGDQHLAQIVTNSYGFNTELLQPGIRQAVQ